MSGKQNVHSGIVIMEQIIENVCLNFNFLTSALPTANRRIQYFKYNSSKINFNLNTIHVLKERRLY